jgi:hypothetical protein
MKIEMNDRTEFNIFVYNEDNINTLLYTYHPKFPLGLPRSNLLPSVPFYKKVQEIKSQINSAEELYKTIIQLKANELETGYRYSYKIPVMQSYNIIGEPIGSIFCLTNIVPNKEQI